MGNKAIEEVVATEKVDTLTGQVTTCVERKVRAISKKPPEEPNYVKLYIDAWCAFKQVKGINSGFLWEILQYMTFANKGQRIVLDSFIKREIAEDLQWSKKTALQRVNTELTKLVKVGVLKKLGPCSFTVNPELIGKGKWEEIKQFKATFHMIGENAGKVEPEME